MPHRVAQPRPRHAIDCVRVTECSTCVILPQSCSHASNIARPFGVHDVINQMAATPTGVQSCHRFTASTQISDEKSRQLAGRARTQSTIGETVPQNLHIVNLKLPCPDGPMDCADKKGFKDQARAGRALTAKVDLTNCEIRQPPLGKASLNGW